MNKRNLKHIHIRQYYKNYQWDKCSYSRYYARVKRWWYKIDSIENVKYKNWIKPKNLTDENGRICNQCKVYKPRCDYMKNMSWHNFKDNVCRECKNQNHREYRKTNKHKDQEYKQRKRKLKIDQIISFGKIIEIDWLPREETRKVISYKFKRWYKIQNQLTKEIKSFDTTEWNPKYLKFYKVEWSEYVSLQSKQKRELQEE